MEFCLAVDVGGTKTGCALVSDTGAVSAYRQRPTPARADPEVVFDLIASMMGSVLAMADQPPVACGISIGGPMAKGGEFVSPLNISGWRKFPVRSRVSEACGLPTFVDNDAKALALAEGWIGGARSIENFMAMVVSTGVGGGLVLDGDLVDGRLGNAGHIGHVNVVNGGRLCACGSNGCLEAEASGTSIAAVTGRPANLASDSVKKRTGALVGRAAASIANLCDLELILVAGSVALGFGDTFFRSAQEALTSGAKLDHSRNAVIRPAGLGAQGPIIGAGAVGWRGLGHQVLQTSTFTSSHIQ